MIIVGILLVVAHGVCLLILAKVCFWLLKWFDIDVPAEIQKLVYLLIGLIVLIGFVQLFLDSRPFFSVWWPPLERR